MTMGSSSGKGSSRSSSSSSNRGSHDDSAAEAVQTAVEAGIRDNKDKGYEELKIRSCGAIVPGRVPKSCKP
jgi:hypothetical protein